MTTTPQYTVHPRPASEIGALDGFEMRCTCGDVQSTSLSYSAAAQLGARHLAWHQDNDRPAPPKPEHAALAAKDVALGVGHDWTAVGCPAYATHDPAACTCGRPKARRVTFNEARRHFAAGGEVLVSEYGHEPFRPWTNLTTTHTRETITWDELVATVREWSSRYPNQRFYVVER